MESTMGERIRSVRVAQNLTQQEFADKIGCARSTVTNYELDQKMPLNPVIATICREFNVSEDWLRTGEGEMRIPRSRDEEISYMVGKAMNGNPLQKAVIRMICSRSEDELEALDKMLKDLYAEVMEEEKNKDQA